MSRKWLCSAPLLFLLSACATHEFKIEEAGDQSADKPQGQAAPDSGATIIVAAGNILLGPAAVLARSPSTLTPSATAIASGTTGLSFIPQQTGSVSGVLLSSGQTIIQLDSGAAVLVGGIGGTVGDAVTLNASTGLITSGPGSLLGSTIQAANPAIVAPSISLPSPNPTSLGGVSATGTIAAPVVAPIIGSTLSTVGNPLGGSCC